MKWPISIKAGLYDIVCMRALCFVSLLFRVSDESGSLQFDHIKGGNVKKSDFDRKASSTKYFN